MNEAGEPRGPSRSWPTRLARHPSGSRRSRPRMFREAVAKSHAPAGEATTDRRSESPNRFCRGPARTQRVDHPRHKIVCALLHARQPTRDLLLSQQPSGRRAQPNQPNRDVPSVGDSANRVSRQSRDRVTAIPTWAQAASHTWHRPVGRHAPGSCPRLFPLRTPACNSPATGMTLAPAPAATAP